MRVTVQLPDEVARQLGPEAQISRRLLEALAIDGYRSGMFSRGQITEMLGLNFWETEAFLKAHAVHLHYSKEDLEDDARANDRVLSDHDLTA